MSKSPVSMPDAGRRGLLLGGAGALGALALGGKGLPVQAADTAGNAAAAAGAAPGASAEAGAGSAVAAAGSGAGASSRVVAAGAGHALDTPLPPDVPILNGWPAHASVLIMLGAARRIAATVNQAKAHPWMYRVAPSLHDALQAPDRTFVLEDLLERNVQLAFVTPSDPTADKLASMGIRVVKTSFQDVASMRECILLTARELGGEAPERARVYLDHLDRALDGMKRWRARLPAKAGQPRVLHIPQWTPTLLADGEKTIIDEWIQAAGGRNAATGLSGSLRPVTLEQLLAWDPDVLVEAAKASRQKRPEGYAQLRAVRAQRVYTNPEGVFPWDRYGCEFPLQLRWAASRLHPDAMPGDDDLAERTQDFYQRFFGYRLEKAEAQRILKGEQPA